MWIIINRQKADQLIFTDFWLLENLWTVKTSSHVRKRLSLDITRLYNPDLVISENILKFHMWKAKTTSNTQNLLLINTEVNIYLKSWSKFSFNNRQPPKALKFNHQPSTLEKTNHQPLRPSYLRRFFATKHFVIVASCIPLLNVTKNSPESYCLYSLPVVDSFGPQWAYEWCVFL